MCDFAVQQDHKIEGGMQMYETCVCPLSSIFHALNYSHINYANNYARSSQGSSLSGKSLNFKEVPQ